MLTLQIYAKFKIKMIQGSLVEAFIDWLAQKLTNTLIV